MRNGGLWGEVFPQGIVTLLCKRLLVTYVYTSFGVKRGKAEGCRLRSAAATLWSLNKAFMCFH